MTVAMPLIAMAFVSISARFIAVTLLLISEPSRFTRLHDALASDVLSWQQLSLFETVEEIFVSMIAAVLLGVIQWMIVRKHITDARNWIWASLIGLSLGFSIIVVGDYSWGFDRDLLGFSVGDISAKNGAIIGAALGIAQWVVLRRHVRWSSVWIPINIAVCSLATNITWGWPTFIGTRSQEGFGLLVPYGFLLIRGVWMYSLVTGAAFARLLSHPKQELQLEPA